MPNNRPKLIYAVHLDHVVLDRLLVLIIQHNGILNLMLGTETVSMLIAALKDAVQRGPIDQGGGS